MSESVQDVLGTAGEPAVFQWKGTDYKFGTLDQRAKARFEELVAQAETAAVRALRGVLPDAEYVEERRTLGRQISERQYKTGGKLWAKYAGGEASDHGLILHVLSLLREHQPSVREEDVRAMFEEDGDFLLMAVNRAVPSFFEMAAEGRKMDPAAIAPAVRQTMQGIRETALKLKSIRSQV